MALEAIWQILLIAFGAGVLRNVVGWLENALEDGKISAYEIGMLGVTVLKVMLYSVLVYYGTSASEIQSASIGAMVDIAIMKLISIFGQKPGTKK